MRLPSFSSCVSPRITLAVCVAVAMVAGGCEMKSFFNPGEVGRFKHEPLLLPIVNSLSGETGIEEPNDQFAQASDVSAEDLQSANQDYVIGKNDLLSISITDLVGPGVETVKTARVSESGSVSLPLIGQVKAEGLTEAQLEQEIIRSYKEQNLMPNAQVSVTVQQALARIFSILGSVQRPGVYQITQSDFRILDALVTAGDVNTQGVDFLYVIRREDAGTKPATTTAPGGGTGAVPTTPAAPADPLTPRSDAGNPDRYRTLSLAIQETGTAQPAAQQTPPAGKTESSDGRYIIIDGKPVLVGNQGAAADAAPAGAQPNPAAVPPAGRPSANTATTAQPAAPARPAETANTFAFNGPNSGTNSRIIRVPVTQLKNGDLRYNIVVRPQDMIIAPLPTTGEYYIDGHVNRTGVYSLTARNITLKQAIAAAGGFDQLAIPTRTEIIRRIGHDKEVFARVDLDKVFAGHQPDIYLKPNDVVRVGTNALAPFIASFRNAFRVTYGFGFLYDRNYAPQQRNQG
ncbi:MAG: hypothetical protein QOF78_315 [Phycisphaerales bacterium]|nr:hypothetical protein [Phycisphaerales bacterium]